MSAPPLTVDEWVTMIETQINSPHANYTLVEKLAHLNQYYDSDPTVPKRALDIVRSNLVRNLSKLARVTSVLVLAVE